MRRRFATLAATVPLVAMIAIPSVAASAGSTTAIPVIADSQLNAQFTTLGGAAPLNTDKTVVHFAGSATDPTNGVTYGYNMVGANPSNCSGSACSVTVQADIQPINVVVGGMTFSGSDVLASTLASPVFATNDYGTTPAATVPGNFPNSPAMIRGAGGALSQGDAGNQLQLQDATMRAQFNQTGSSNYHLILQPNVLPAVTIVVPANHGTLLASGRGVIFADVDINWWGSQINNLEAQADPTHLPIYLTNDVMAYEGNNPFNCCVIGFHGAKARSSNGNGSQKVQTFAWASYVLPGLFSRANGGTDWALQDIHALSHEIAEWADDPFVNNLVNPWVTPTAPQYGCTGILETGDPVVGIGFAMGTNTYAQGPNPNGTQSADGYYHPEDEVFAPWFFRTSPSTAEASQVSAGGRYTLMGDLNPFSGFRAPATGC